MQPRNAAILFLVAVALGAFVYLYEIQGEGARDAAENETRRMFQGVEPEAVEFLAFRTQDDRALEAVRAGAGWLIQSPVVFPGDEVNLDAIASTLANLTTEAEIDAPGAPQIYGLGDDARWVRFRVGPQTHGLGIGAETPVGGNVYVKREGDGKIYTAAAFRVGSFDRDLASLRDRRVLDFDRTQVNRISASWSGGRVVLERREGAWSITDPVAAAGPADQRTVDGLLSDVAFLRAEGFDDTAKPVPDDAPYFSLRMGLAATEAEAIEVGFQALEDPASDDFLVRNDQVDALYRVPRARIVDLPREVFDYRFKQLAEFEVAQAQAFELVLEAASGEHSMEPQRVRVERAEQGWASDGAPWVPGRASGLIAELAHLEAVSLVTANPDPALLASVGLAPPRVHLRVFGAGEPGEAPLLAEVALGTYDAQSGIVARAGGQQQIFRISAALADAIPIDLDAFDQHFVKAPPATAATE